MKAHIKTLDAIAEDLRAARSAACIATAAGPYKYNDHYYPIEQALDHLRDLIIECRAYEKKDRELLARMSAEILGAGQLSSRVIGPDRAVHLAREILAEIDKP